MVPEVSDDACPNRCALMPHGVVVRPQGREVRLVRIRPSFSFILRGFNRRKRRLRRGGPSIALQCPDALGLIEP